MGELEGILARRLVWREALLRLAGEQGVQDAYPRAAVALSRVHAVHGLRRQPPEARCAVVAGRQQAGCGCRARAAPALSPQGCRVERCATAQRAWPDHPRPDATAGGSLCEVLCIGTSA